ncbi:DUF3800 domain-containing protein, partial [Oceanospirillum sp. HFRX-1_2]
MAVAFPDDDIKYIRDQVADCLVYIKECFNIEPEEFHFVDIYNRKSPWDKLPDHANLGIFEAFAKIYNKYKWKVFIQTVDDRTLRDHGVSKIKAKINQFDLEKPSDLSLFLLLIKIKKHYFNSRENLMVYIDEGLGKPKTDIGNEIFYDYKNRYTGKFQSSSEEPLLQLADFIAFSVNRSTHLYMKENRTEVDNWFLCLFNSMGVNSDDLARASILANGYDEFKISNFDALHLEDRENNGVQS